MVSVGPYRAGCEYSSHPDTHRGGFVARQGPCSPPVPLSAHETGVQLCICCHHCMGWAWLHPVCADRFPLRSVSSCRRCTGGRWMKEPWRRPSSSTCYTSRSSTSRSSSSRFRWASALGALQLAGGSLSGGFACELWRRSHRAEWS